MAGNNKVNAYGWDSDASTWRKQKVDADGKLVIAV
jgi:hypothetical protein